MKSKQLDGIKVDTKDILRSDSEEDDEKQSFINNFKSACRDKCGACRERIEGFLNHTVVQGFTFLATIYALLGDDLRLLVFTKEVDEIFTVLSGLALLAFSVEIVLASIGIPDYFSSFFFWLDLISTVSIIADIPPIWDAIVAQQGDET